MELFILRHAIAETLEASGSRKDSDRALTGEGAAKMKKIAASMKSLDLTFDLILTSPYVRARQTAEIVARELDLESALEQTDALVPGEDFKKLIDQLNDWYATKSPVLLVGHEPFLSGLISLLISGHSNLDIKLKKGGLAKLTVEALHAGRCATLEWLAAPRMLARLK